jgi:glycosyltransferase involved in cell wall biosynthesis
MEIHQVVVAVSPGDAVTNAALELRDILRRIGPSDVFARYIDPRLAGDVLPLEAYTERYPRPNKGNVLVYHASIGEPEVMSFLLSRNDELVLVYHNITPAEFFIPYDPMFARLLALGRSELALLRTRARLALAPSAFNAAELRDLGYEDVRISPLVIDHERLRRAEAHWPTLNHLQTQLDGPVLLFVGQLLPHKRPDLLLQAYHVLVTELIPEAHLAIVGSTPLPAYHEVVQRLAEELNLSRAWLLGPVSQEQLVAYYRAADLLVTMSEHEGFCLPLVEAMAFDVPVIARRYAAIPETMGGAGLVLPPDAGPELVAESMAVVLEDDVLRKELVEQGRERLAHFDALEARATFLRHLASVL